MKHRLVLGTLAGMSLLAGPAFAAGAAMMGGISMADHATQPVHYVNTTSGDMMSSKLVGMDVYNNQNDKVGEIQDLVINDGKSIAGVVVSVGGFLGMGEHYVLLDPASIAVSDKNGTMKAMVDANKDSLKAAPTYNYKKS